MCCESQTGSNKPSLCVQHQQRWRWSEASRSRAWTACLSETPLSRAPVLERRVSLNYSNKETSFSPIMVHTSNLHRASTNSMIMGSARRPARGKRFKTKQNGPSIVVKTTTTDHGEMWSPQEKTWWQSAYFDASFVVFSSTQKMNIDSRANAYIFGH